MKTSLEQRQIKRAKKWFNVSVIVFAVLVVLVLFGFFAIYVVNLFNGRTFEFVSFGYFLSILLMLAAFLLMCQAQGRQQYLREKYRWN